MTGVGRMLSRIRDWVVLLGCVALAGALILLNVRAAPAGVAVSPLAAPTVNVLIVDPFAFSPAVTLVTVGATVRWTNNSLTPHTTTSDVGGSDPWDSGVLGTGGLFSRIFSTPGSYAYHCGIHPDMQGIVKVLAPRLYLPVLLKPATL